MDRVELFRELKKRAGVKWDRDLAHKLGCSSSALCRIKSGERNFGPIVTRRIVAMCPDLAAEVARNV